MWQLPSDSREELDEIHHSHCYSEQWEQIEQTLLEFEQGGRNWMGFEYPPNPWQGH